MGFWGWYFTICLRKKIEHAYSESKVYNVCLKAILNTDTVCNAVCKELDNKFQCSISYTTDISKGYVNFTLTPTLPSYANPCIWDFGDGTTFISDYNSKNHNYMHKGKYLVCVTVKDTTSNCESTFCDSVKINDLDCTTDFHAFKSWPATNPVRSYDFYIQNHMPNRLYSIDFGDGIVENTSSYMIPHTYVNGGLYKVCLTTTTDYLNECVSTFCDSLSVTTCIADFTYTFDPIKHTFYFTPFPNNSDTKYQWYFDDGSLWGWSDLKNPSYRFINNKYPRAYLTTSSDSDPNCHDTIYKNLDFTNEFSENDEQVLRLENYPNPFRTNTTILYHIPKSTQMVLSVVDLLGRQISLVESGNKSPGDYTIEWNAESMKEGIYRLQLKTDDELVTKKMVISK